MKTRTHNLCTFEFNNGTTIHVAVPAFGDDLEFYPFDLMLEEAKRLSWNGDETHGRGGLRSFTVGSLMFV